MLFNSLQYLIFLPLVFALYWGMNHRSLKLQNLLLLAASYYFYACWDWRFLFLLVFSTGLDYYTGLKMKDAHSVRMKKFWFWLSIGINVGFLGIFKYYNFFAESFAELLSGFGFQANLWTLQVILPVGISFYTFHGLSYVIDIYKNRIEPERNIVDYSLFVSYFPLLVAGPIERATHLLPQIKKRRNFDYTKAVDGLRQILWGLFKKVVIADNCANYANVIFENPEAHSGSTLALGAVFFAFQIYGDFSGYSDIALGTSRLFGIELLKNFNYPYFSRDIAEFWRRWHISLSTWFRDYLYIPLGGSQGGTLMKVRNTFIIFLVSGFWHGANWTFIVWGLLNALFIMPSIILNTNRNNLDIVAKGKNFPTIKELIQIILTFGITCFAWIFFRAKDLDAAFNYVKGIFSDTFFNLPHFAGKYYSFGTMFFIFLLIVIEWLDRENNYGLQKFLSKKTKMARWFFYLFLIVFIFIYSGQEQSFIYFQF
ncbi:membrane bound O-acyl transferase MBOAT family protein [Flavobacterium saliperosum S13]|uniref:D-alanyl-lipoteichoic acid acyltransferase DltB, MBOAT superfamily n=2 Tax=Flavobacterium saliperosum TaxID=329186 RepID=A0A1G4VPF7_9FLAO|nr:MBOAT family O-acyltransferase [Flavobacterium saliperosum]ESU23915.1 membrane bound O-acyl transferase MBOAT family protein [Flavobacterium saliperosum S13]SCX09923.1 D-alanyl-lipoteichoic acid acyltransferase DltB, MBOAT superfamily [Flavobacterium saliperosum]